MTGFFIWCCAVALPFLIWFAFRKGGYKRTPLEAPPGPDWAPTGERFVDPTSGETLDSLGIYEIVKGERDKKLRRREDLETC